MYGTGMSKTVVAKAIQTNPRARQQRSVRTEDKLLSAAVRVLDREGLDGATAPRLAAEAKLSPASIYRRFSDKDDLLRAALLRVLEITDTHNAAQLRSLVLRDSLSETAEALIGVLLRQHREHPQLLGALSRMMEVEPDSVFAKEARRHIEANLTQTAEILLAHRAHIRHPDPARAVRFGRALGDWRD